MSVVVCSDGASDATYTRDLARRVSVFVRLGPLPYDRTEASALGVSVLRAYWDGDRYLVDVRGMEIEPIATLARGPAVAYYVHGRVVGRGAMGEPLLAVRRASPIPRPRAVFGWIVRDAER